MNKAERQQRHRERLKRRAEHDILMAEVASHENRFMKAAWESIRTPFVLPDAITSALSLFHLPSFDPVNRILLEEVDGEIRWRRKTWRIDLDLSLISNAPRTEDPAEAERYWHSQTPTIEQDKGVALPESVAMFRRGLVETFPPPRGIPNYTCDGELFELTVVKEGVSTSWEWANRPPGDWQPLGELAIDLLGLFGVIPYFKR